MYYPLPYAQKLSRNGNLWISQKISVSRKYNRESASSVSLIMAIWKHFSEIKNREIRFFDPFVA